MRAKCLENSQTISNVEDDCREDKASLSFSLFKHALDHRQRTSCTSARATFSNTAFSWEELVAW